MGAAPIIKLTEVDQRCPDGDAPCIKNVGAKVRFYWRFAKKIDPPPDVVHYKITGTTIEKWDGGIDWWTEHTLPVQMIADVEQKFRFRPITAKDREPLPSTGGVFDTGAPALNYETDRNCTTDAKNCGLGAVCTDTEASDADCRQEYGSGNQFAAWLWKDPGAFTFTVEAFRRENDGITLTPMCDVSRTFTVERATDDPDRQAVDYYGVGGRNSGDGAAKKHAAWHEARDHAAIFMGEDWLVFHRYLVRSFDEWRAFFGYPPITAYDGSTPVPASDGGYSIAEPTRPGTFDGTFRPDCYKDGTGCAPGPWFTAAGDGRARGDDIQVGRCVYATDLDHDFLPDDVLPGQTRLTDFQDLRGLGCVVNKTHHALMHQAVPGAFQPIETTPADPLFWLYHKWASGIGSYEGAPTLTAGRTAEPPDSVLSAWERGKAAGPPGITTVFPPRNFTVPRLPGVLVLFWEPVTGVAAGDLVVDGSPATKVVGSGAGPYVFSGFGEPPLGMAQLALGAGTVHDPEGQPFAGDTWILTVAPDRDGDDVPDPDDNCPDTPNPDQANTDRTQNASFLYPHAEDGLADDLGDACDPDDDGDQIPDEVEIVQGSDPLDWRDPDPCPLDPEKTDPGDCGCGVRDVDQGNGQVACFFATSTCTAVGQACDDGDACTADACVQPQGCVGTALPAYDGLACRVGALGDGSLCGVDPVQKKLAKLLAKQAKVGRGLAIKASHATKDAKRKKLLHRIDLLLGGLTRKVDAAAKRGKITAACGTTIDGLVAAARALLPPLTP